MLPPFTNDEGDLVTTPDAPTSTSSLIGGVAVSASGEIHIGDSAPLYFANGVGVGSLGRLAVAVGGTVAGYNNGLPVTQSGRLVVQNAVAPAASDSYVGGVRVSASGGVNMSAAGPVVPTAPVNTVLPVVSGTPIMNATLSCSKGTWTGSAPITYTYQWYRGAAPIGGATSQSYVVVQADIGQDLKCTVTATNVVSSVGATSTTVTVGPFTPASLFLYGEQGAWYDPSDISTLFQDLTGTIPVTALGDPIGRINDKSGNGNYAYQGTATARPVYNQLSSVLGVTSTGKRLKYDLVDDDLLWYGPTATYSVAVVTLSGSQIYDCLVTNGWAVPIVEHAGMVLLDRALTTSERSELLTYFAGKLGTVPVGLFAGSVTSSSFTSPGGNSGAGTPTWTFGDGTIVHTMAFGPKTVSPRESLTFETSSRSALIGFQLKDNGLSGLIGDMSACTSLKVFYFQRDSITGSIAHLASNAALEAVRADTNLLTGNVPNLSAMSLMDFFSAENNRFSGWDVGAIPSTLGTILLTGNRLSSAVVNDILAAVRAAGKTSGTRLLKLSGPLMGAPTGQGLVDKDYLINVMGWTVTTN